MSSPPPPPPPQVWQPAPPPDESNTLGTKGGAMYSSQPSPPRLVWQLAPPPQEGKGGAMYPPSPPHPTHQFWQPSPQPEESNTLGAKGGAMYSPPLPQVWQPAAPLPTGFVLMTPTVQQYDQTELSPWSTGLLECWADGSPCCITCFCPCVTFGRIAEIVDQGSTSCGTNGLAYGLLSLVGLSCLYSYNYRSRLRSQFMLEETPCSDVFVHCCSEHCALCQEYRELRFNGFDMSIGWHANMQRRQMRGALTIPAMERGME